jgi:hypothetical protein
MAIDLLFGFVAVVVIVFVFSSRARREKATTVLREHILQAAAPILDGSVANGRLTGTYKGYFVEASLRTSGRIDAIGDGHSGANTIEMLLLVLHRVSGTRPWGFFTSMTFTGGIEDRWRSAIAFAGVLRKLLNQMSPIQIDLAIDARLRERGMLEALERLVPRGVSAPYLLVSFVPDVASGVARKLERMEALGDRAADRARHEGTERLKLGGRLRIEVERASEQDPTPDRFRELLDAAVAVAELNASGSIPEPPLHDDERVLEPICLPSGYK